jgi:glycosyltransferase involved in cell wall biosynthesis
LAVLEAALCGAALVLADIPTFRELWEGAAQFVPADDPVAWARAINALAAEPAQICALGARAQERAGFFCSPVQAEAMLNVYRTAISQRSAHLIGVA